MRITIIYTASLKQPAIKLKKPRTLGALEPTINYKMWIWDSADTTYQRNQEKSQNSWNLWTFEAKRKSFGTSDKKKTWPNETLTFHHKLK